MSLIKIINYDLASLLAVYLDNSTVYIHVYTHFLTLEIILCKRLKIPNAYDDSLYLKVYRDLISNCQFVAHNFQIINIIIPTLYTIAIILIYYSY